MTGVYRTNEQLKKRAYNHRLFEVENATFTQGEDEKRESKTNRKEYNSTGKSSIPTAKEYFNTTEILNRLVLSLRPQIKKRLQEYFKKKDD